MPWPRGVYRAMHARPRFTDRDRTSPPRTDEPRASQPSASQPRASQPRADENARAASGADVWADRWSDLRPQLGGRGAIATMFMSSLIGDLAAKYLHASRLAGFGFAIGCIAAASLTRRPALPVVVTTPPLIFLIAITCAAALAAHAAHVGLSVGHIAAGVFLTLASSAPWLFGGFATALVIATCRGLARNAADRRQD